MWLLWMLTAGCMKCILMKFKTTFTKIGTKKKILFIFLIKCLPEISLKFLQSPEFLTTKWVLWIVSIPSHSVGSVLLFQTTQWVMIFLKEQDSGTKVNKLLLKIIISCKKFIGKQKVKLKLSQYMCHSIS